MPVNLGPLMFVFGELGRPVYRVISGTCAVSLLIGFTTAMAFAEGLQRFDLRVENGRLAGNLKTIRVQRNDAVEINWSADRRTVLHLHGYDIETVVEAGKLKTMSFTASATGRFPVESHGGRHVVLLYIEVHPR